MTLPFDLSRPSKLGRIQGEIYDHLFSPDGLSKAGDEARARIISRLADELRQLIDETHVEIAVSILSLACIIFAATNL